LQGHDVWQTLEYRCAPMLDSTTLSRAFELMDVYADYPMDLADASLIVAAETLTTRKVFTIDRQDFAAYRVRRGHRQYAVEIIP
jgi:predicted nucleic acid-binding protein